MKKLNGFSLFVKIKLTGLWSKAAELKECGITTFLTASVKEFEIRKKSRRERFN
jgi:hypothetical protein